MFIERALSAKLAKTNKSILLLGPRQTGKSTLVRHLAPELVVNLADERTYLDFARNPSELPDRLEAKPYKTILIDEVQRLPSLLNTLQSIIDEQRFKTKFYLTGSSARKLKRGGANLLPGRIHVYHLGPLALCELEGTFHTRDALEIGTLPGIYTGESREEQEKTLRSYSATYLKEEIQAEALTRNLEGFSRFLFVTAQCAGQFLDLQKLASEAQVARQSVSRYFEILEDTLILNRCIPFAKSDRKRLVQHPKFYFFDTGVLNGLLGNFIASDDRKGMLFEHLFFNQLLASAFARDLDLHISTYRTEHGTEVDFIVELAGELWAIELKASRDIGAKDFSGLMSFEEFYRKPHTSIIAYWGTSEKRHKQVHVMNWQQVLKKMGL